MPADDLSTTFAALADPTRRAILARLTLGETSVTELAKPFEMTLPAISKHLKVLEGAGLIRRGRKAQWRPCRLQAGPLKNASNWIEQYRRFWEESLDRLGDYLNELRTKEKPDGEQE
ncbi:MAG TPA: metalloregulator ArsR/SmtB family transcription factor [Gemmataceae bacterium]|nr:metalloregulator ArsR/SmtB family transcription factor [Gemmataceae bacterium]